MPVSNTAMAIAILGVVCGDATMALAESITLDGAAVRSLIVGHTVKEPEMTTTYKPDGTLEAKSKKKKFLNYKGTYTIKDDGQICVTNPAQSYCLTIKKDGEKYLSGSYPIVSIK